MTERHAIAWAHGMASVQSLGGMLGPVLFLLPDGRQVAPLHVAPWFHEPDRARHPAIIRELRGEWPCVPFGADGPRDLPDGWLATGESFAGAEVPHGHSANTEWRFTDLGPQSVELVCDYPDTHPVERLRRRIAAVPDAPALEVTLEIAVRRPCALPVGLHPTLRLPVGGTATLVPPAFRQGRVFPLDVEPGQGLLEPGATFAALDAVPTRAGGAMSLLALPLAAETEELVQLCGVEGTVRLRHPAEGWQVRLDWDAGIFPSLLLWISNRGRHCPPWNGRHLALGVEPVCAAFDLGPAVSNAPNPIAQAGVTTALHLDPAHPFVTRYRLGVEASAAVG